MPAAAIFAWRVVRPALCAARAAIVARRIERHIPEHPQPAGHCVDLAAEHGQQAVSLLFRHRLVEEAVQRILAFEPVRVIDLRSCRLWLLPADPRRGGLACDLPPLVAADYGDRGGPLPWADIPPVSGVLYTVEPGDIRALRRRDRIHRPGAAGRAEGPARNSGRR